METLHQLFFTVNQPEGYTQEAVSNIPLPQQQERTGQPDIILILNETYYDLDLITDLQTDLNFKLESQQVPNMITGYAVVPGLGGGTNSAEYELLTSNSLELMPGVTPFNTLDLKNANSIVSHLNRLGYHTLGTHCEPGENYSRSRGYEQLGFQEIYFQKDYVDLEDYHGRGRATDKSLYRNLIRWYEQMPDQPRFLYMLTIQNHGDYHSSDDHWDLVHANTDYGELNDDIDEYLTSVYMSNQAFVELTEYFSTVDRPVIICMTGDHCPSFAPNIIDKYNSIEDTNLMLRSVPVILWANFPLEEVSLGQISMNQVIPMLLDQANVQTSPFYAYLSELRQQTPIITSYGDYYDTDGIRYTYTGDAEQNHEKAVDQYFYLEYQNIMSGQENIWYLPY